MKYIILLFPCLIFGQITPSLSYEQTQDISYFKKIKNRTSYFSYTTQEGITLSTGDTLVLANPSTNSSNGNAFIFENGSAQLDSKDQKSYEFIQYGKRLILRNNQFFSNQSPDAYPTNRLSGERVIIKEIVAIHRGSRKKPLAVYFVVGEQNNRSFGFYKHLTIADVENAISYGEISLLNGPLTRGEVIAKLKEAKELLDIEIISQEEYDETKSKLSVIIKQLFR